MQSTAIKMILISAILLITSIGYACESIVNTIRINGSSEVESFKWELSIAEIPYLFEENAIFSTFVWMMSTSLFPRSYWPEY